MFTWLLYNTVCALPLALIALVVPRFKRSVPALEHFLWLLVIVRLILPPLPGFSGPENAAGPNFISSGNPTWGDEVVAWTTRTFGTSWSNELLVILAVAFAVLLALLFLRELVRVRKVDQSIRAASGASERLGQHVRDVAARLGTPAPKVRVLPSSASPFIWSLRGPVLVLPEGGELPEETVLAHEFAHIRRFDHWTSWLELLAGAFHFWNPLFWLARRRLHLAAELACDSWVVEKFPADRRSYATALVEAVERSSRGTLVPRAVHAVGVDQDNFEVRLRHIMRAPEGARFPRSALLGAVALAAISLPGLGAPTLDEFRASLPELPDGLDRETWLGLRERSQARIEADADDAAAYGSLGMAQLGLGNYEAAAAAYLRQVELDFEPGKAFYNLACVSARAGNVAEAVKYLERSQAGGVAAFDYALQDPDLENVREHPAFTASRK